MSEIVKYRKSKNSLKHKSDVPVTITWKNARMIRAHSLISTIKEILNMADHLDLVKINIVGNQSTGKSTLSLAIAHLLHKYSKVPFTVKVLDRNDLINFKQTMQSLPPVNHVLIFDDISFLDATSSQRKIKELQQTFTEIRHLPGKTDVKIITIFNFHYTMATSKYLRQSNAHFYTTIGTSDIDNVVKLFGVKDIRKIRAFNKLLSESLATSKFTIPLGNKGKKFTYTFREPFAPVLYNNNDRTRTVVYPKREWIDKLCPICANAEKIDITTKDSLLDFDQKIKTKFGSGTLKQALRILLFINGISTYDPKVKNALTFIKYYINKNPINFENLAEFYELEDKKTKLRIDKSIFNQITN